MRQDAELGPMLSFEEWRALSREAQKAEMDRLERIRRKQLRRLLFWRLTYGCLAALLALWLAAFLVMK